MVWMKQAFVFFGIKVYVCCLFHTVELPLYFKIQLFFSPPPHLARETVYHPFFFFFFSKKNLKWQKWKGIQRGQERWLRALWTNQSRHASKEQSHWQWMSTHSFFSPECWPKWIRIKREDLERTLRSPSVFDTWALIEWQPMLQSSADGRGVIPVWKEVDSSRHRRKRSGWRCCEEARWWKSREGDGRGGGLNANGPIERRLRCASVRFDFQWITWKRKVMEKEWAFLKGTVCQVVDQKDGACVKHVGWVDQTSCSFSNALLLLFRVWTQRGVGRRDARW